MFSAFGKVENALVISGNEADMVIIDIMVRLLTSKRVTFNYKKPLVVEATGGICDFWFVLINGFRPFPLS
ncbi:hypothetical protein [uncultured Eudoraea sp.]|uniref:hypothetical protein n=1 Tax=uncultured Eudoraea sp. TaxID=1035614 RepID=UPI00261A74E8|nr:hypothetical protein [uncultured Eudoraea sp.]